ncbi:hypothetical protein Bbelb_250520 [Branchiostoma belcheri]|nr:hypothetical protein Bbelb_250520 [Branchiostoma belcheri]
MWWYRNGDRIDSDDKLTAFISQRYLVSGKVVFFLWYTVKVENAAAFGTYECRYEGDNDFFRKSLQNFSLEPENWEVQAQDFFDTVKVLTDRQRLYEEGIRWRDNALSDAYYIIFVVVLAIVVRLISWIRQKFLERDIRVTLGNIQQMDALKGCGEGSHRYDVFISHSSVDASWVQGDLLDNLESNGYTVCLDTRDFMADWTEPMARETFWAKLHEWLGPPSPPLDLRNEEDVEEVEEWFECHDSETCQQDESNPADSQESDDFVLRHRQNIPNAACD